MSVVGIGTDIVEIDRIAKMAESARLRLAQRVLTEKEYQKFLLIKSQHNFLAKRWAGKEAAAKALGKGIADGISFQHIEIKNLNTGQPVLVFTDRALEIANQINAQHWHISLSDEKHYATAFVVLNA
ncbi:holo-ACP synthase [Thalassotalea sp. PLHSN55]|uniref:holo-ACP synthase n=1 Tax=Thalassotalea sp. PLHSN55 TaxID=3435888 RepID=UPI003F877B6F